LSYDKYILDNVYKDDKSKIEIHLILKILKEIAPGLMDLIELILKAAFLVLIYTLLALTISGLITIYSSFKDFLFKNLINYKYLFC